MFNYLIVNKKPKNRKKARFFFFWLVVSKKKKSEMHVTMQLSVFMKQNMKNNSYCLFT